MFAPPVILYRKGQPLKKKEDCIAVVGSRTTTPYGRKVAQNLAGDLIKYGITIDDLGTSEDDSKSKKQKSKESIQDSKKIPAWEISQIIAARVRRRNARGSPGVGPRGKKETLRGTRLLQGQRKRGFLSNDSGSISHR